MEENFQEKNENKISEPDASGVRYYQPEPERAKPKTRKKGLIIFGCVVLGLVILGAAFRAMIVPESASLPASPYIAVLYVEGTIQQGNYDSLGRAYGYQHEWSLNEIDSLMNSGTNKGLVLFVDSPGGGVYESDELYFKVKEYQEETGRPVYAAMGSMAASGGYYVSAPADKIFANRNCWTGSIGVTIGTLVDLSEFLERYGIKTTTIASGENKSMGGYFDPLTTEQQAIFQSLIDEAYDQFAGIVAEERKLDIEEVKRIADGRIYTAKQALSLGLIDEIGTLDEAISDMEETYQLGLCDTVDLYYVDNSFLGQIFGKVSLPKEMGSGDAAAVLELLDRQNQFPVSYLCEALQ